MRSRFLVVATLLVATLALAQDERTDVAPFNPFAECAVGDWEVLSVKQGDKERFEEWTIAKVEDDKVVVKIDGKERTFSRKDPIAIKELFPGATFKHEIKNVRSGRATLPLSGEEFRGDKVSFNQGELYISTKVKGAGIIQRTLEGEGGEKASLVGHGTKDKTIWGKTLKEASAK